MLRPRVSPCEPCSLHDPRHRAPPAVSGPDGVRGRERPFHHDDLEPGIAGAGGGLPGARRRQRHGLPRHSSACGGRRDRAATVAFACFTMGWIGGGDAKVAAAAALWFGFGHLLNYLVYASLFGGALTLLLLQFRQWPLPYRAGRPGLAAQAARQGKRHSLRHRARDRRVDDLSGDRVDQGGRPRSLRHSLTRAPE